MDELGQLGVVTDQHHAFELAAKLLNDIEQVIRVTGIEPSVHRDVLALAPEAGGDEFCRCECAYRRTRQDQVGLHIALRQSLAHLGGVALAPIGQWPVVVGQRRIVPARLGVAHEEQRLHAAPAASGGMEVVTRRGVMTAGHATA